MTQTTSIVVTGATGFIGRFLTARLSGDGHQVYALARRAAERRRPYAEWVDAHGGCSGRVTLIESDLTRPELALAAEERRRLAVASFVFHVGASMQWGTPLEETHRTNVEGTERVFELARSLPGLRRFVLVTGFGVGVAPQVGRVPGGAYEVTKIEADRRIKVAARARGVPLTRVHPANVIGDSRTGEAVNYFGFGDLAKRLAAGKLFAIPGNERTWYPLIPVDYVADFLARVPLSDAAPATEYYVVDERTPPLGMLLRDVARQLGVRAPRLHVPLSVARALARAMGDAQALEALYFLSEVRFDTDSANRAAAAHGLVKPELTTAIERHVEVMRRSPFWAAGHGASAPEGQLADGLR